MIAREADEMAQESSPLLTGVLYKRGAGGRLFGRHNWKLRYFELAPTKLQYFKSADKRKLRGELSLVGPDASLFKLEMMPLDQVHQSQSTVIPKWRFAVCTPKRRLLLAAFTETEMMTWAHQLGHVFPKNHEHRPANEDFVKSHIATESDWTEVLIGSDPDVTVTNGNGSSRNSSYMLVFDDRDSDTSYTDGLYENDGTTERSRAYTDGCEEAGAPFRPFQVSRQYSKSATDSTEGTHMHQTRFWKDDEDTERVSEPTYGLTNNTFRRAARAQMRAVTFAKAIHNE